MPRLTNTLAAVLLISSTAPTATLADAALWQGFYGGLSVGAVNPTVPAAANDPQIAPGYAIFAGYNHALGSNWVIGGELSYGMSGAHSMAPSPRRLTMENTLTASLRGGYAFGNSLVYARLGYQQSDVMVNPLPFDFEADGMVYGIGFEQMLAENLSARIEYTHADLDLRRVGFPGSVDYDTDTISVGIAFHF